MKKLCLSCAFIVVMVFTACSSMDAPQFENAASNNADASTHTISQEQAIEIADLVLDKPASRSTDSSIPEVQYVVSDKASRSSQTSADTLAYVINYPDNAGFVIVSADNRVYPVLGFSDTGYFSFENEIATANFISRIEPYIEQADDSNSFQVDSSDFSGCVIVMPQIKFSLGQRSPWDKYVIESNPNCPVGCVAVATALVMSHTCDELLYHGVNYPMASIKSAIDLGQSGTQSNSIQNSHRKIGLDPPQLPVYTYEQAVDSMAKILYWIGKDLNMKYTDSVSTAYSYHAYTLCESLGFSIPLGYQNFDINEVVKYLKDDHIIYIHGRAINPGVGHAWISDGCRFCVDREDNSIINAYIHCDWGWDGLSNGYYIGDVFETVYGGFIPTKYFAAKIVKGRYVTVTKP